LALNCGPASYIGLIHEGVATSNGGSHFSPLTNVKWIKTDRPAALRAYDVFDSPGEEDFDDLARVASGICGTPMAVVNLVDPTRQFFKAEVGLGVRSTPVEPAFCSHALLEGPIE
jgi:hypothetical protein